MNPRLVAVALLMLALGAAGTLWLRMDDRAGPGGAREPAGPTVDYAMQDFTAVSMGKAGRPAHRLAAKSMSHLTNDVTELTEPRMTLFRQDAPPWYIRADRGRVSPGGEQVTLVGNVRMWRPAEGAMPVEMTTSMMLIRPEKKYAETDRPLTITEPKTVVKAVGMRAFMNEERLVLLSEVRGKHVPQPN